MNYELDHLEALAWEAHYKYNAVRNIFSFRGNKLFKESHKAFMEYMKEVNRLGVDISG